MQLSLFNEEPEQPEPQGDTYYCNKCKQHLPERAFASYALAILNKEKDVAGYGGGGKASCCKACRQEYDKGKRIAIKEAPPRPTEPIPCDCCGKIVQPEYTQLDHDHITYAFRGWLCKSCNTGIGQMGDTIEGLQKGIAYLERHERK